MVQKVYTLDVLYYVFVVGSVGTKGIRQSCLRRPGQTIVGDQPAFGIYKVGSFFYGWNLFERDPVKIDHLFDHMPLARFFPEQKTGRLNPVPQRKTIYFQTAVFVNQRVTAGIERNKIHLKGQISAKIIQLGLHQLFEFRPGMYAQRSISAQQTHGRNYAQ